MPSVKSRLKKSTTPIKKEPVKKAVDKVLEKPKVKAAVKKVAPIVKASVQKRFNLGAALPVGGVLPPAPDILDEKTIDQLSPHVFIHALNNMDMPTHQILKGIAANYLNVEHPLRKTTKHLLGGDFIHPKHISKIATRDVMKSQTPQELAGALHSEWLDMMAGKLSPEEIGGGLFSSLKMLVKKGVKGAGKALQAVAKGAKGAVQALGKGATGAKHISQSLSNALQQGVEVANVLAPAVQAVFPASEGIIKEGLGKADAAQQLLQRGIDLSAGVEKGLQPIIEQLGPIDAPIVVPFGEEKAGALPQGQGLDLNNQDGSDISGSRFIS